MSTPDVGPERPQNAKADHKAAKAYAKATRPWYKKKRWWASGLLLILIIASVGGGAGSDNSNPAVSENPPQDSKSEAPAAPEKPAAQEKPAAPEKPEMTSGQKRALESAEDYLGLSGFSKDADFKAEAVEAARDYLEISPMSKDNLIEQLTSSAGGKFTRAEARYAVGKVY